MLVLVNVSSTYKSLKPFSCVLEKDALHVPGPTLETHDLCRAQQLPPGPWVLSKEPSGSEV